MERILTKPKATRENQSASKTLITTLTRMMRRSRAPGSSAWSLWRWAWRRTFMVGHHCSELLILRTNKFYIGLCIQRCLMRRGHRLGLLSMLHNKVRWVDKWSLSGVPRFWETPKMVSYLKIKGILVTTQESKKTNTLLVSMVLPESMMIAGYNTRTPTRATSTSTLLKILIKIQTMTIR